MQTTIKSTPKDVFLHLFNIVTFYLVVIGFITLFIQYINALFPDALNYYFNNITDIIRTASSILFIAVPAYIYTAWLLAKDLKATPEKRELKLRKWLTYFTLFISAITIIIDLMIFVYNFLNGELTVRFFLKVLVVLLIAAAVFGYYLWELKRQTGKSKLPRILAIVLVAVTLISIFGGFFIVGTPNEQRRRKMDDQRVMDLQLLQGQIIDYWTRKQILPTKLESLQDNISGFIVPTDPETKVAYSYQVIDKLKFELCATFATTNKEPNITGKAPAYTTPYGDFNQNWNHDAGQKCFSRTIDPDLYKPINSTSIPAPLK
jgi:type II secretory pathway pseudopilin PulG